MAGLQEVRHALHCGSFYGQSAIVRNVRTFSVLNRPPPNYKGHVPLNGIEKGVLAVGSAIMALRNPYRHGDIILFPVSGCDGSSPIQIS